MSKIEKVPEIKDFIAALSKGREAVREAADILCRMVDANPRVYDDIVKANPGMSYNLLANLERVGRGVMHFELLFDGSPAARKMISLPASQQKELYEKPVKVVSVVGGKTVVEEKRVQQLSPAEARTLFAQDHVRTIDEQIKVAKEIAAPKAAKPAQRYTIEGDKITILANTTFTAAQLEDILAKMVRDGVKSLQSKK